VFRLTLTARERSLRRVQSELSGNASVKKPRKKGKRMKWRCAKGPPCLLSPFVLFPSLTLNDARIEEQHSNLTSSIVTEMYTNTVKMQLPRILKRRFTRSGLSRSKQLRHRIDLLSQSRLGQQLQYSALAISRWGARCRTSGRIGLSNLATWRVVI